MRIYPNLTVDGEFKSLGDQGHMGTLNDRQFSFLRSKGYQNSLADMMTSWLAYSPANLFSVGEQGVWFDPSDVANLNWRRNLLTWTEQFDNAAWVKADATISANVDGVSDKLIPASASTSGRITQTITGQVGSTYTLSVEGKAAEFSNIRLYADDGGSNVASVSYNLSTGAIATAVSATGTWTGASTAKTDLSDGYLRLTLTWTATGAAPTRASIWCRDTGSGTNGILIRNAQLELGSVATDYQRITDVNTEVIERFPTATLYQDTAGTTPVTTTGQSVGLMLDKSKGLVLGSELVTNGDFSGGSTGWTPGSGWSIGSGAATHTGGTAGYLVGVATVPGRTYRLTFTITASDGRAVGLVSAFYLQGNVFYSSPGTYTLLVTPNISNLQLYANTSGTTVSIDNVSLKELPGNHAVQATTANRPIYGVHPFGGRRNLLTWTTFGGAVAGTPGTAPTDWPFNSSGGSITSISNEVIAFSATAARQIVGRVINVAANQTQIWGVTVVSNPNSLVFNQLFTLINPTGLTSFLYYANGALVDATSYVPLANDRLTVVLVNGGSASTPTFRIGVGASGVATGSASFTQPQAELGSTATAYQRVTDQYNVTEAGVSSVSYLFFDGVNDSLATPTITPGVDKAQVFAGVRKLSDAAVGIVIEHSANVGANNGSFYLASGPNGTAGWSSSSRGTTSPGALQTAEIAIAAPDTAVLSSAHDIANDLTTLRRNGVAGTSATGDKGTGNFLAYPLYLGARAGTSLFFSGHLYGLIARFGPNLATGQISSTETWVAGKTGVVI